MEENQNYETALPGEVIVYNRFIRNKNVLLSELDCSALFSQLEQHQRENGIEGEESVQHLFRELLGAFTLHCASRPRNEMMAWTIRYTEPMANFFFAGDTEIGSVAGRFFQQHVKEADLGEMHQELHRPGKKSHTSMVEFSGNTVQSAIHQFYNISEQRPARFFDLGNNRYALVSAHPDYDEGWFTHIDLKTIQGLEQNETLNLLETRKYFWLCGCSKAKILEMLAPMMKKQPEAIFGEDETATVNCPRCGAQYPIEKRELEKLASELEEK